VDVARWQRTGGSAPGFWQHSHCWALGQEGDLPILSVFGCPFSGSKRSRPLLSTAGLSKHQAYSGRGVRVRLSGIYQSASPNDDARQALPEAQDAASPRRVQGLTAAHDQPNLAMAKRCFLSCSLVALFARSTQALAYARYSRFLSHNARVPDFPLRCNKLADPLAFRPNANHSRKFRRNPYELQTGNGV
jgi:hypothetical protein